MRTETYTVTKEYFTYEELSEKAKEFAKQEYLHYVHSADFFYEDMIEDLRSLFPNSELDVMFSLNGCQGDGLNIYGRVARDDILAIIDGRNPLGVGWSPYTEDELHMLKEMLNHAPYYYELEKGYGNYCYSRKDRDRENIKYEVQDWVEECRWRGEPYTVQLAEKFMTDLVDIMDVINDAWEEDGWKYFSEVDDEEMQDMCDANNWEFYEDGTLA